MKKIIITMLVLSLLWMTGCSGVDTGALLQQVETVASQVDVEGIVTKLIDSIDWNALKTGAEKGYDALTEQYPALKQENIKSFLKENGLKLMSTLVENADDGSRENARKLGEIIKILYPDLTVEVDAVIGK